MSTTAAAERVRKFTAEGGREGFLLHTGEKRRFVSKPCPADDDDSVWCCSEDIHASVETCVNLCYNLIGVLLLDCPSQVHFCSLLEKDDAKQKRRRSPYQFKLLT